MSKRISFLFWSVIRRPTKVYNEIREQKVFLKEPLFIYMISIILYIVWFICSVKAFDFTVILFIIKKLGEMCISFSFIPLSCFVANIIAVKMKGENNFKNLFICSFLIAGVMNIFRVLAIILPDITVSPEKIVNRAIITLWQFILIYIMVKRIYNISTPKTIVIFFAFALPTAIGNYFLKMIFK